MTPDDGARLLALLPAATEDAERTLLLYAREAPFLYGHWRHVKGLYKAAENDGSPALVGTLIGRFEAGDQRAEESESIHDPRLQNLIDIATTPNFAVATTWLGIVVLDLSNLGPPQVLAERGLGDCKQVVASAGTAFVEVEGLHGVPDRVYVLDLINPAQPTHVGSIEVRALKGMAVLNGYLILVEAVGAKRGRLRVFDLQSLERPVQGATLDLPDAAGLALVGTRAFVNVARNSGSGRGVYVVELAEPLNPVMLGFFPSDAAGILVGDRYLEGSRQGRKLALVDTAAPLASPPPVPAPEARPGLLQRVTELFSRDQPAERPGLRPRLPAVSVEVSYPTQMASTVVHNGHAYLAFNNGTVDVIALQGPKGPQRVGSFNGGSLPLLAIGGEYLHVIPKFGEPEVFDISMPSRPIRVGVAPQGVTLEYLKRRGRRLLRNLGNLDPNRFVETAYHTLRQSGVGRLELDPQTQWVSIDLLYGASGRYEQARHGRGPYRARWSGVVRRIREERYPEAWDRRPDLVRDLYSQPDLPWQTHETMLKILQSGAAPLPVVGTETTLRFLRSPSPLLIRVAVRQLIPEIEGGKLPDAEVAARAYFFAPAAVRGRLVSRFQARSGSPNWARPFAASLTGLIVRNTGARVSGRVIDAAGLLTRGFAPFVPADQLLPVAETLLGSGRPEMVQLVICGFRTVTPATLPTWLSVWSHLPEASQKTAWEMLTAGLKRGGIPQEIAEELVLRQPEAVREVAWRLLLALTPSPKIVAALWDKLLSTNELTPELRTALSSPAALLLFQQTGPELERLSEQLVALPGLSQLLPASAVEALAATLPVQSLFPLIGSALETVWPQLRDALLRGLLSSQRLAPFWKAAPGALVDPEVQRRLTGDPVLARSFQAVAEPVLIEITDPPFEALLREWLEGHAEFFSVGSPHLLTAATHPLPSVREWALERIRQQGMDVPLALRLMESEVPPSVALGRSFFENLLPGDPAELGHLLSLTDSPDRATREFGRTLIRTRLSSLDLDGLISALAEHGDPEMNRFLGELLSGSETTSTSEVVQEFDRAVLRAPNRGRRAKEQVKTRLDKAPVTDTALLLELARGGTPRDAEWALSQLARLAAEGTAVEGLSLEGVAGV